MTENLKDRHVPLGYKSAEYELGIDLDDSDEDILTDEDASKREE